MAFSRIIFKKDICKEYKIPFVGLIIEHESNIQRSKITKDIFYELIEKYDIPKTEPNNSFLYQYSSFLDILSLVSNIKTIDIEYFSTNLQTDK
jgi:hypothetical protein